MARPASERIVVTGRGCVTPLGSDLASTWQAALAGHSGVAPIHLFDAADLGVRIAAQVDTPIDVCHASPKEERRFDRFVRFALAAAREAIADAGLDLGGPEDPRRERAGVAIGSGIGGLGTITSNYLALLEKGARRVSPFTIPMAIGNMASGYVSIVHGLRGPNLCHVSACASGAHAIGESLQMIRRGDVDVMVAGGAEAPIVDIGVAGFAAMRALSTRNDEPERASRPFDCARDGFVVGEGAGVVVLESLAHARARGAPVLAEVLGYAASADARFMAAPDPAGEGAARCIALALRDAGLSPGEVAHINAHATSTPPGDCAEVVALRSVFGEALERIPVSATKSMTGHLLGAAGAVEAILSIEALRAGMLPPTINLDDPDPECALDHVAGVARASNARTALSNSFGFGGTNASLVFGLPG